MTKSRREAGFIKTNYVVELVYYVDRINFYVGLFRMLTLTIKQQLLIIIYPYFT